MFKRQSKRKQNSLQRGEQRQVTNGPAFLFLCYVITYICYVSVVLKVDTEPVISFFNRGRSFFGGLPFCISVRNTIYVMEIEMLGLVVLARKHKSGNVPNLIPIHMISQVFPEVG